ncbi:19924_t:CDS:2, partial [Funneliformis geosporum]
MILDKISDQPLSEEKYEQRKKDAASENTDSSMFKCNLTKHSNFSWIDQSGFHLMKINYASFSRNNSIEIISSVFRMIRTLILVIAEESKIEAS